MFNLSLGKFLDSLDHAAKETFEEPPVSATALRSKRKEETEAVVDSEIYHDDEDDGDDGDNDNVADIDLDNEDDDDQDRETDNVVGDLLKDEQQEDHSASFPSTPIKNSAVMDTIKATTSALDATSESVAADSINAAEQQPITLSHDSIDPTIQAINFSDASGASPISISKPTQDCIPINNKATTDNHDRSPIHTSTSNATTAATTASIVMKNEGGSRGSDSSDAIATMITKQQQQQLEAERSQWKSEKLQLKKAMRKMRQEIEELNRECLELETQSKSLKSEVKEAWDNYNKAQEKAVFRESELHDEVKQLQKGKLLDKQHLLSQISKTNDDLAEAMKQVAVAQMQRDDMQLQLNEVQQINLSHQDKLNVLKMELLEAKNGSLQGVQSLREELRVTKLQNEQMQHDNSSLLRHSQLRQAELEEENAALSETIGRQQSEINRLTQLSSSSSSSFSSSSNSSSSSQRSGDDIEDVNHRDRAYFTLQQEIQQLHDTLDTQRTINVELDRKVILLEREVKASALSLEDERKRSECVITELTSKVAEMENTKIFKTPLRNGQLTNQHRQENEASIDDVEVDDGPLKDYDTVVKELQEFRVQAQNLSKLLLKKQGTVMELQAEKSALKSRLTDMEGKLWTSEQQLIAARAELDDAGEEDGLPYSRQQSTDNLEEVMIEGGLQQFRHKGSDSTNDRSLLRSRSSSSSRTTKVIYDLEKIGVKPSLGVTRAVNMIDAWTIVTGRFLRNYPLARLAFVLYLLVLHSWVLVVLVIKTHSLELDNDPHQHISGNLRASHVMN